MNKIYTKKLIGTTVLSVFMLVITLTGVSFATATPGNNRTYTIDGLVTNVSSSSITVKVSSSESVVVLINDKTTFTQHKNLSDIHIGNSINAKYKKHGNENIAQVIKLKNKAGYGDDDDDEDKDEDKDEDEHGDRNNNGNHGKNKGNRGNH